MVGMHPDVMPLGAYLHQDLYESVDYHVNLTSQLPENKLNKFNKCTSKHLVYAYKRISNPSLGPNNGAPSHTKIKEDIERFLKETSLIIVKHYGYLLNTDVYTD